MNLTSIAEITTLLSFIISLIIWATLAYQRYVDRKLISIHLQVEDGKRECYRLKAKIPRRNLTRSEVLGLLGMIPKNQAGRFQLDGIIQPAFFSALESIQQNKGGNTLIIQCNSKEIQQFDREKLKRICHT